ncbi:NF038122 family metalloprotease [Bradyrhizobium canariense]|uniref:NF038122 family metalloprotease n=1 Tax=Bradyrhizobium canariense TaxID=255045 RepID=UPI001177A670|nr:NF038122 family metalloprotease [Bradyrhizobium canariense]
MISRLDIFSQTLSDAGSKFLQWRLDCSMGLGSQSPSVLQSNLRLGGYGSEPATPVPSDDPFYTVIGNTIQGSYFPTTSTETATDPTNPASVFAATSGGATINLIFDAAAMAAPASFRSGVQQAAAILAANITDKITLNIKVDYSGTGGGAAAGPDSGYYESYSWVRSNLLGHASVGDTTFNALPNFSSIQGQSSVAVWNAQLKLWGVLAANDATTDDGSANFATDINPNLLVGVALHELTHAMGRVPYGSAPDIFDLFRFTSPGARLFQGGATAPAAYFSADGGNTKLADYGQHSDPSDFLNSGVQGPNDPFNEYYTSSTSQSLSTTDLKQLDALGFHLAPVDTTNAFGTIAHSVHGAAGQIYALYDGLLGRAPDPLGYEGWMATMEHGTSLHDVAATFLASPEGLSHVGSPDSTTFVEQLYETALHRSADSGGLQYWTNQLNSGESRPDVALSIVLSAEHVADMQLSLDAGVFAPDPDASNVARLYYGLLGRAPDAGGLANWTNAIKSGVGLQSVAQSFINSAEYRTQQGGMTNTQFIDSLYVDALGRHADPSGLQDWLSALSSSSQASVAVGIAESTEAQQHHLTGIEAGWLLA